MNVTLDELTKHASMSDQPNGSDSTGGGGDTWDPSSGSIYDDEEFPF
jgi:hypothetical protein